MEGPEFDSRIVCGGGQRMMSWRSYGFNMYWYGLWMYCWPVCRTCEEILGLVYCVGMEKYKYIGVEVITQCVSNRT